MIEAQRSSPAETLLRYLWVRRTGSALQFREATKYCFGSDVKHVAVARRLCALGHVEFDWDGPELRWRVVRPSFYRVDSELRLCGVLSQDESACIEGIGARIESYEEEFLPGAPIRRYFVSDLDGRVTRLLGQPPLSFPVAREAYHDLMQRLAPIQNLLLRKPIEHPPQVVLRFNTVSGQFDQEIRDPEPEDGLLKDPGFGKPRYFFENHLVDLTMGLWLSLASDSRIRLEYRAGTVTLPAFPDLPPLFERVLYLSGARRKATGDGSVEFAPVERGVAAMIISRLGVRFSEGLTKA